MEHVSNFPGTVLHVLSLCPKETTTPKQCGTQKEGVNYPWIVEKHLLHLSNSCALVLVHEGRIFLVPGGFLSYLQVASKNLSVSQSNDLIVLSSK